MEKRNSPCEHGQPMEQTSPEGGGEGGTLIFSHIRRLGLFFWVQNSEFHFFGGVSEK